MPREGRKGETVKDDKDDGWDLREEGESLFEWPLDSAGMRMGAGQLLGQPARHHHRGSTATGRMAADHPAARAPATCWSTADRRTISAVCLWKRKPVKTHKER